MQDPFDIDQATHFDVEITFYDKRSNELISRNLRAPVSDEMKKRWKENGSIPLHFQVSQPLFQNCDPEGRPIF
jgi:hypothetical protein